MARILLCEAHDLVQRWIAEVLVEAGHEVFPATSQAEAVARCRQDAFDLLITSGELPDGSGEETARRLWECDSRLPVLIVTSFPDDVSLGTGNPPRVRTLAKPCSAHALRDAVDRLLDSSFLSE